MTSGTSLTDHGFSHRRRRHCYRARRPALGQRLRLLIVLLGSLSHAAARSKWTVEVLMGLLKEQRENSVPFQEATYSSLLTEPLIARGVLKFVPPGPA